MLVATGWSHHAGKRHAADSVRCGHADLPQITLAGPQLSGLQVAQAREVGGTGICKAEVTTRLYWRVATGHTVTATNSVVISVRRSTFNGIRYCRRW